MDLPLVYFVIGRLLQGPDDIGFVSHALARPHSPILMIGMKVDEPAPAHPFGSLRISYIRSPRTPYSQTFEIIIRMEFVDDLVSIVERYRLDGPRWTVVVDAPHTTP